MMNHLWVHMHLFPPHPTGLYHKRVGGKHTRSQVNVKLLAFLLALVIALRSVICLCVGGKHLVIV